ncbi:exodeoxyribonuclease VII large subunit [Acidobacterium sp.]|nr:exodeoxyribonuclease VII large subunit [Acidobacterium sp.]
MSSSSSQRARQHPERDSDNESQMGLFFEAPVAHEDTPRIWKIGELVTEARAQIERRFAELRVEGEISNLRAAPSGHLYFTLKDGEAQLPAVFFRRQASLLRFRPQDGMQVLLRGRLTIYEQRGQMQMVGETMEPLGAGSLQVAFEQLKAKLKARGLFDAERKRPIPAYPRCVGIVTSPTGAVIRDFLNIVQRRHAALQVLLYPATVQGEGAAAEVAAGISYFNRTREVDAIVVARGGGSLEDLAPFNTEPLAEAIAASELPVVSAVGHETDFTIADFVADLRAPTPSAAAELITAAQHRVEEDLSALSQRLERAMRFRVMQARHGLDRVRVEQMTVRMMDALHRRQQKIDELSASGELAMRGRLQQSRERLGLAQHALARQDVVHRLHPMRERLDRQRSALERAARHYLSHRRERLHGIEGKLRALSPMGVLERGYALVFDCQGRLVKSVDSLKPDEEMTTRLADGNVTSTVRRLNKA